MTATTGKWATRVIELLAKFSMPDSSAWRNADRDIIHHAVNGISPYSGTVKPDAAARAVFNIPSVHVPDFLSSSAGAAYKNRYDVAGANRIGSAAPNGAPDARKLIDETLATLAGQTGCTRLYYGAVEINGAGVRYYGDLSLVLKTTEVLGTTLVLDRNSFDLICAPLRKKTHPNGLWDPKAAQVEAEGISGIWAHDLADIAVCKVLKTNVDHGRRITVGAVSQGVLEDEDYLEVIRVGSFGAKDVDEVRVSAADAAVDGLVADRLWRGPTPDWTELLWRHRRRKADQALKGVRIRTRVVVSSGRVRS